MRSTFRGPLTSGAAPADHDPEPQPSRRRDHRTGRRRHDRASGPRSSSSSASSAPSTSSSSRKRASASRRTSRTSSIRERRAALLARADDAAAVAAGPVLARRRPRDRRGLAQRPALAGAARRTCPADLAGARVLDVGSNAGYDPFMFRTRGATEILACEPFEFIEQARFLEEIYRTGVDFQPLKWEDLDPAQHGTLRPRPLPRRALPRAAPDGACWSGCATMLADGGTLFFGSMMLAIAELSEYARFVPGAYYGDPTWWWVPGRLCLRWMLETAGLRGDRGVRRSTTVRRASSRSSTGTSRPAARRSEPPVDATTPSDPAVARRRTRARLPPPARARRTRSRSGCCTRCATARTSTLDALRGVSFAVEPGEFFGIVGRNGSRQEHAAEVPRRHLPARPRRDPRRRPAVDVHRARRRLQPRPRRPRQRGPQRDHDRALAARGEAALRRR